MLWSEDIVSLLGDNELSTGMFDSSAEMGIVCITMGLYKTSFALLCCSFFKIVSWD